MKTCKILLLICSIFLLSIAFSYIVSADTCVSIRTSSDTPQIDGCIPQVELNKTLWDEWAEEWSEYSEDFDVEDIVIFNISVVIPEDSCSLCTINISDNLLAGLWYLDDSTDAVVIRDGESTTFTDAEPNIVGSYDVGTLIFWNESTSFLSTPLNESTEIYIEFEAMVTQCGDLTNTLNVTGSVCETESTIVADFTYSPNNPYVGDIVSFMDRSNGSIISWSWTFGDGSSSDSRNPTHKYDFIGSYPVSLQVTDGTNYDRETKTITIRSVSGRDIDIIRPKPPKYPNDPYTVPEMYQLLRFDKIPVSYSNMRIAFIDTGYTSRSYENIDLSKILGYKHPDLASISDNNGHGTWISYAICYGVNEKMPNVDVISIRVFDDKGGCSFKQFLDVLDLVETLNIDVVSFSGGYIGNNEDIICKKIQDLKNSGIIFISAAGNEGPSSSTILNPAASNDVIGVGAIDPMKTILELIDDVVTDWSSRGPVPNISPKPDCVSPGESILGPWLNDDLVVSGTSMSTPFIATGCAGIYSNNKGLLDFVDLLFFWDGGSTKSNFIESSVAESCYDKGDQNSYGYGIPDFEKANNILFWKCIIAIIIFIVIICLIVGIIIYLYHRKNKKKQ